jgi:SAM-dependent methyltransferase
MNPIATTERGRELARRLAALYGELNPIHGAEIGVCQGQTSATLLEALPALGLVMVDTWTAPAQTSTYWRSRDSIARRPQAWFGAQLETAKSLTDFARERRVILQLDSAEAAELIEDGSLDFLFVDADHSYEGCSRDLLAWERKVRPGGLFAGHDWANPTSPQWGVQRAVWELCDRFGLAREAVETGPDMTWFVRR